MRLRAIALARSPEALFMSRCGTRQTGFRWLRYYCITATLCVFNCRATFMPFCSHFVFVFFHVFFFFWFFFAVFF